MSAHDDLLLIKTGDPAMTTMAHDPSSPLGLRFATEDEISGMPGRSIDAASEPEMPEGFRRATPEEMETKRLEKELLSQEELLEKIERDRITRDGAEFEIRYNEHKERIAQIAVDQQARLANDLRLMLDERRPVAEDLVTTAPRTAQAVTTVPTRRDETPQVRSGISNPMASILRIPLIPFVLMLMLIRIAMRALAATYAYATGDTPERRKALKAHHAMIAAQNASSRRLRDPADTSGSAPGPRIARDPRIVDVIARAENVLRSEPDLADAGGARIDDLVRQHLPRLEDRRRRILELGAADAVAQAAAMVEKALTTAEISLNQAIQIASKVHLDDLGTEVRFLEMRTPDDGSKPEIAPLAQAASPAVRTADAAETARAAGRGRSQRRDVETYVHIEPTAISYAEYSSDYDCGGGSSSSW